MKIKVVLFASARDILDSSEIEIDMAPSSTVGDLKRELSQDFPALQDLVSQSVFAVNHEYALDETVLDGELEVALIPPVSGG